MKRLEGKTALVTGASRGIGRGIAARLAADGAHVAVNYANSEAAAHSLVEEITAAGGKAFAVQADITDLKAIDAMFGELKKHFKELHIVVNNAGRGGGATLGTVTPEQYDANFSLNTRALFFVSQGALEMMPDGGRIINLTSMASQVRDGGISPYAGSKAAADAFTRGWATELAPRRITVNSVNPGMVKTDMIAAMPEERRKMLHAKIPMGRIAEVEEIANVVAFVASDEAGWITGATIPASGGRF